MKPGSWNIRPYASLLPMLALCGCALFGVSDEPESYTVERGDTLYSIAWQYDLDYRELAAWNGILPPYVIRPGQELQLERPAGFVEEPVESAPEVARPEPDAIQTTPLPGDDAPEVSPRVSATEPFVAVATIPPSAGTRWRWPVEGEVLKMMDAAGPGINIGGNLGQPVRAAAGGRVVYSGSGLQGYGQLVIVKHDDDYLTAYGYNRRLLVRQGDEVHVGQPIAEMGEGPQRRAVLHFEIRRNGQALDPLHLLPVR